MVAVITIPGMFLAGDHASRPAAGDVGAGSLYACSTHALVYQSDGSSWTTWLDASGVGGGTGQGLVDFASLVYTAGDITCDQDSAWEDLAGPGDLTLNPAASGDWIEVGVSFSAINTTNVSCGFDVGTIVSAAVVNHISTGAAPDNNKFGVSGWRIHAANSSNASGSILYQLQSGDITGGTVVLRLRDHPEGTTNRNIDANTNRPLHFWAKNLGPSI